MSNNENQGVSRRNFLSQTGSAATALGLGSLFSAQAFAAHSVEDRKTIDGKIAIVTGSSRGIGAAVAKKLASHGCKVMVNCVRNRALAAQVVSDIKAAGGDAIWLQADVRKQEKVKELFDLTEKTFGGIDFVISNAGVMKLAPFEKMSDEDFEFIMDTNLKGGFYVLREAARRVRNGGRIITTSSSITQLRTETYGPYAASKAAQEIFANILAKELKGRQISVNSIAPGVVNTTLFTNGKTTEQIRMFEQRTPFGRLGEPEDIANVVMTLCQAPGAWINGQTIFANGGIV
jgi:3-oxoacyl-[acyl-carrier protein] reductase